VIAALVIRALGPDDPLGPVNQDADEIRQDACRLVAPDSVCSPRQPSPPDTSSGGGTAWAAVFEIVIWVVFFSLIAALVFVIVRVLLTTNFGTRRRRRKHGDDVEAVEELSPVVIDRTREPADWRREAEEHRAAGRHRDAVRCRYRALVGDLARRGLIDEIPGRTSGEERIQMTSVAPREAPAFSSAAELFDEAWFGDVPVADADVQRMEALEVRVLAGAGAPAS
jgi:hypothetical protein